MIRSRTLNRSDWYGYESLENDGSLYWYSFNSENYECTVYKFENGGWQEIAHFKPTKK